MRVNKSLKIIFFLYFISCQVSAENEVLNSAVSDVDYTFNSASFPEEDNLIKQDQNYENKKNNFFIDAINSSLKLIINFDASLLYVVTTSLKISFIAVLIASLIGVPLGIIVALNNFTGKNFLLTCLNTLMAVPTVVIGLVLYGILNRQGLLGEMALLYTPVAIIIGQCFLVTPIIWNLSVSAITGSDIRLKHACTLLGASQIQRIFIYLSETRFALMTAVAIGFGRAIGEVGIAMILGGNIEGFTRTMTTAIALETNKGTFDFALALGFMLLFVAFFVNIILHYFQSKSK